MKVDIVLEKLQKKEFLDKRNIYIYASLKSILGGIMGSISGLVLLCVYEKFLYGEQLAKIYIPNMKNIQGKAGLFGGKFSFNYEGQEYKFKLPSKAGKFVDFFVK
mgnify:CR=1 FL=1